MNESGAILDAAFEKLSSQDEINIILISGDLSNNGERESHREFLEKLARLKAAGKRVYVTTATHDYGLRELKDGESVGTDDGKTARGELRRMYFDYGFSESIADYADGLSYVAKLQRHAFWRSTTTTAVQEFDEKHAGSGAIARGRVQGILSSLWSIIGFASFPCLPVIQRPT